MAAHVVAPALPREAALLSLRGSRGHVRRWQETQRLLAARQALALHGGTYRPSADKGAKARATMQRSLRLLVAVRAWTRPAVSRPSVRRAGALPLAQPSPK